MSRLNINNWPFRKRLHLLILVAGLGIIIYAVATIFIIKEYEHTVARISQGELSRFYQISHGLEELSSVHTEMFRLFSTAPLKHDAPRLRQLGDELIVRLDILQKELAPARDGETGGTQAAPHNPELAAIARELLDYRNSAGIAITMLAKETGRMEEHLLGAADGFDRINRHLSRLMSDVTNRIDSEIIKELHLIKRSYWPMSLVIILLSLFMLSIFYRIIAILSANFDWIDTSLDDLRSGNTNIDIPVQTGNNEMGKIYSSLDKFRASLIDLRQSQREMAENNRQLREESEQRLLAQQELTRTLVDLSRAMQAAEASNKAKSLFLANISHEIRTPLNAVLGMAQVLQTTGLDATQADYVDTLYTQGRHLLQVLNSVLDFSRLESGKLTLLYQSFRLDSLLNEVTSLFIKQPTKKDITLEIDIAPEVENLLYGDPLRIRQILINLLSNAYKFTRRGKITIHIENGKDMPICTKHNPAPGPGRKADPQNEWRTLYFTVTDTGIGIAKDKQQYIFDNFTQADESLTREYGGTGIGLAICKQLVELMNGEIGVNSEPGRGASFWFRICLPNAEVIGQQQTA